MASWREFGGWDKNRRLGSAELSFDLDQSELTLMSHGAWPKATIFDSVDTDPFGKAAGGSCSPGPFVDSKGGYRRHHIDRRE